MYVERIGMGERAFLALHGWAGSRRDFTALADNLTDDVSLYCVDMPGFGDSPPPRVWFIEELVGELRAALGRIEAEKVTLLGNCSGAVFGLALVKSQPHRFERIVLIDAFAFFPKYFSIFLKGGFGKMAYLSTFANPVGRTITNVGLKSKRNDKTDLSKSFKQVDHAVALETLRLLKEVSSHREFAGIDLPCDIVIGDKTFRAIRRSVGMWQENWPDAALHEVVGAGHMTLTEEPERVAEIVFARNDREANA